MITYSLQLTLLQTIRLLFTVIAMMGAVNLYAQTLNLEKLLMPGKLGASHAELESDCQNCHSRFNKSVQNKLCLECHEDIQSDLQLDHGFHSRIVATAENLECGKCHTDHNGRANSLTLSANAQFNHHLTDFPLEGAHTSLDCKQCHQANKLKREADTRCYDCHQEHDIHQSNLGDDCSNCHNTKAWSNHSFDHNNTDFSLLGKHRELTCSRCHINHQYQDTADQCIQCHALDDVHKGNRGDDCGQCHSASSWQVSEFDHDKETGFKLEGIHQQLSCGNCHRDTDLKKVAGTSCIDCHRSDDLHLGLRGNQCKRCHRTSRWPDISFNHDRATDFPLRGAHKEQTCQSCHTENTSKQLLSSTCNGCHQPQDIHEGAMGKDCQRCHNENNWVNNVIFDHDLSSFPLAGLHALIPCEQCHISRPFKHIDSSCVDCHRSDDKHEQTQGEHCANCHTPNGWSLWSFDHNSKTDFLLDGKHNDLACSACHKKPVRKKASAPQICGQCHIADDAHDGDFGKHCDRCHSTSEFSDIKRRH